MFLLCAFIYVTLSTSQRRDSELSSNLTNANAKISALSTELATTNTNLKTATADSGWKYMTANNLSEKLKFRKIGHVVSMKSLLQFIKKKKMDLFCLMTEVYM